MSRLETWHIVEVTRTVHLPDGQSFEVTGDWRVWDAFVDGSWEPQTLEALAALVTPETHFVDIGAHVGETSLSAAALGARVLSFEPDPVAYAALIANVKANDWGDRIRVQRVALAARDRTARLTPRSELGDSMSSLVRDGSDGVDVSVRDVRAVLPDEDFLTATLIKVDVEGAEYELLPAMREYLSRLRPDLLISIHAYQIAEAVDHLPRGVRGVVRRWRILRARLPLWWLGGLHQHRYVHGWSGSWEVVGRIGWLRYLLRFTDGEMLLLNSCLTRST